MSEVKGTVGARVVLVDKPRDWTSFQVVRKVRSLLPRGTKVGHAGTLDPFATGLLLVLVGQATRISSLLMDLPKEYVVTAQFGAVSKTQDCMGEITPTGGTVGKEDLEAVLPGFVGGLSQRIPMTSAAKVGGTPLYKLAHRGLEVDTPEKEITVHQLTLEAFDDETQAAVMRVRAGKGTYVRTLVHDMGQALGAGAYAAALRRTRIGAFAVEDASAPDEMTADRLRGWDGSVTILSQALRFMPVVTLDASQAASASHGATLGTVTLETSGGEEFCGPFGGRFLARGPEGLVGIYEGPVPGARPMLVFPSPED